MALVFRWHKVVSGSTSYGRGADNYRSSAIWALGPYVVMNDKQMGYMSIPAWSVSLVDAKGFPRTIRGHMRTRKEAQELAEALVLQSVQAK